jgi:hypothetical protein
VPVSTKKEQFTAASSAAGYYYQARLALLQSLRLAYGQSNVDVAIERLDDVSFEAAGLPLELIQTKHHIDRVGDLTDFSADLWKTLSITVVILCWHICLISESMGHHDSEIMDDRSID